MSKQTVSAAGGAMPAEGHKSRRALLRLFGAAPALAILPAGPALALASTASLVHPDAALLAMQPAIDAADRELDAALDALKAADDAYSGKAPDRPAQPETVFTAEELQAIDALAAGTMRKRGVRPSPAWVAYEQSVQDHEREVERLKAECGVTAAHELEGAALDATGRAAQALVNTPAKTLAGLIFKARHAASHYSDDYDEEVMVSIVDDLLTMADDSEGLANVCEWRAPC
jgi:hypothetical protein